MDLVNEIRGLEEALQEKEEECTKMVNDVEKGKHWKSELDEARRQIHILLSDSASQSSLERTDTVSSPMPPSSAMGRPISK